jgi:hypothetical protein
MSARGWRSLARRRDRAAADSRRCAGLARLRGDAAEAARLVAEAERLAAEARHARACAEARRIR